MVVGGEFAGAVVIVLSDDAPTVYWRRDLRVDAVDRRPT